MNKLSLSGEHLSIQQVVDQYEDETASLREYFSTSSPSYVSRFRGFTAAEVSELLRLRLEENNKSSCLTLLAAMEGLFQVDYTYRVLNKLKDPLSREFREIERLVAKRSRKQLRLDEDIFEAWQQTAHLLPVKPKTISDLRTAFKYRHWLAHGRYWIPKLGRQHDFDDLLSLAIAVEKDLPLQP